MLLFLSHVPPSLSIIITDILSEYIFFFNQRKMLVYCRQSSCKTIRGQFWYFYCVVVHQRFQGHRKDCLGSVPTGCKVCAEGSRSKHIVQSIFFLAGSNPIVQGASVCSPAGSSTSLDAAVRANLKGMILTTVPLCQQLTF